jgi:hypothetical protein
VLEHLARSQSRRPAQRVATPELEPVDREPIRELVHQRFVRDRALRNAKAANAPEGGSG